MTTRRQVQTPGKPAEQAQPEAATPDPVNESVDKTQNTDETAGQTAATEHQPPLDGATPDLALSLPEILETLHRIEEHLANGSPSTPVKAKPKKGRFKFVEGKGHVWVEE